MDEKIVNIIDDNIVNIVDDKIVNTIDDKIVNIMDEKIFIIADVDDKIVNIKDAKIFNLIINNVIKHGFHESKILIACLLCPLFPIAQLELLGISSWRAMSSRRSKQYQKQFLSLAE